MFHRVDMRRHRTISLLGFLFVLLVILASVAVNQPSLHQTHAASACQGPPAGFDPTAANVTNAQLEYYGLPARPSASKQSEEYVYWLNLVQHDKYRVCTTSTSKMAFSGTSAVKPLSMDTTNKLSYFNYYSGYAARSQDSNASIRYLTGTWQVPCLHDNTTATMRDQVSVGFSTVLLAIGTQITHTAGRQGPDTYQYYAYLQGLGISFADPIAHPISCGNTVNVQIMYDNIGATPQWNLYIADAITNSSFSVTYSASQLPPQSSGWTTNAFWGEYTPGYPLYNFGSVVWLGNKVAYDPNPGTIRAIDQWNYTVIEMRNSGKLLAQPSLLTPTGAGFTDTWKAAS
jgi:hypothetical protein